MSQFIVSQINQLQGEIVVPGDKSISHRSAIFSGLAKGRSHIKNFLPSEDCVNTLQAMIALGAKIEIIEELAGFGPTEFYLEGRDGELQPSCGPIDCGNAGTGMRLLAGLLAGQNFLSMLVGDESLSSRPMDRVIIPLSQMGAEFKSLGEKPGCAPLEITGGKLQAIEYTMPMASAQVKSAILLAGLKAQGTTVIHEPAPCRDHTERMLGAYGVDIKVEGRTMSLEGGQSLKAAEIQVPADVSSAAFWLVAASAMPGAEILLKNIGLNPTRDAVVKVLKRMGADIQILNQRQLGDEPVGDLLVKGSELGRLEVLEEEVPNLIDEVPILAVAGALSQGGFEIRKAKELRVKETDRIDTVVKNLRKMGAQVEEFEDGMIVQGNATLQGAELESYGDHRIAMAFAIAGLFAQGQTVINNVDCVKTSYPTFEQTLQQFIQA